MRRRTSLAAVVAFSATWALSACGIPTGRAPEVIGDAPSDFDPSSGSSAEVVLPTNNAEETVGNYLKAAAGDPDSRNDRLNKFTSTETEFSDASAGLDLLDRSDIAIESEASESATLVVTGSIVGTYLPDGSVRMHSTPRDYSEKFVLQRTSIADNWELAAKPKQVVLDYSYFKRVYARAPLYFQAGLAERLVPDLRWIYDSLEPLVEQRLLLNWLTQGPSDFTSFSARNAIPEGTVPKVVEEDGVLHIDLALGETVDDDTFDAIAAQVSWSLDLERDFILTADGEPFEGSLWDWRKWNAIPDLEDQQIGYFIADETVKEYTKDQRVISVSPDHPWVGFQADGLKQVTVDPDGQIAAIVAGPDGDVLQVGSAGTTMREVGTELGDELSDPQWFGSDAVIVIDGGEPSVVYTGADTVQALPVGTEVTSLALAADGRRLAFVEDGLAWVAAVSVDADGNIQAGSPKQIGLGVAEVTDVAWSSENYLWVAGRSGSERLLRVAIDNSRIEVQDGIGGLVIDQIGANPADPVKSSLNRGEPVLMVANGILYRVETSGRDAVIDDGEQVEATSPFTVIQ